MSSKLMGLLLLLLLLLYISHLHGCHARNPVPDKKPQLPNQEIGKDDEVDSGERKPSVKVAAAGNGGKRCSTWNVPHEKEGDKHPGFNLDYSPPKTHPPVHN